MANDLHYTMHQINSTIDALKINYDGTLQDLEIAAVYAAIDKILGEIKPNEIRRTMANMYFAGQILNVK